MTNPDVISCKRIVTLQTVNQLVPVRDCRKLPRCTYTELQIRRCFCASGQHLVVYNQRQQHRLRCSQHQRFYLQCHHILTLGRAHIVIGGHNYNPLVYLYSPVLFDISVYVFMYIPIQRTTQWSWKALLPSAD